MTFSRALLRVAGQIGFDGCATVLGKSESLIRKLSDPDTEREISLQDARRLDAAHQRAGGEGAPFLECYALQLEMGLPLSRATAAELLSAASDAAKEGGEAVAAALVMIEQGDCESHRRAALIEVEEAIHALTTLAARIGRAGREAVGG